MTAFRKKRFPGRKTGFEKIQALSAFFSFEKVVFSVDFHLILSRYETKL